MKKYFIILLFLYLLVDLNSQQNSFFIKLSQKDLATFNDAITMMKLIYNENDSSDVFIENILWAAGKKLFQVTIPIKQDSINPIITRSEFAYWLCKAYNLQRLKNQLPLSRLQAYNLCVSLGIMNQGRGQGDSFSGQDLIDTFSYLDFYVRYYNIQPVEGSFKVENIDYDNIPEWRAKIYKELDAQQLEEKKKRDDLKKTNDKKKQVIKKEAEKNNTDKVKEKYIDNSNDM